MIFHYISNTYAGLKNNLLLSFQSILSLIIGVLGVFFIALWIFHELNTDKFHQNSNRIFLTAVQNGPMVKNDLIEWDKFFKFNFDEYPEIDKHTSLNRYNEEDIKLTYDNIIYKGVGLVVDSSFLEIFDFPLSTGTKDVLSNPNNLVITRAFANKIFKENNPIGESVTVQCDNKNTYQVAGIIEHVPSNSSIQFDFLIPSHSAKYWSRGGVNVMLTNELFKPKSFNQKVDSLGRSHPQFKESKLSVVRFDDIYFHHSFGKSYFVGKGDYQMIKMLLGIGIILFFICLFNFINLQGILFNDKVKRYSIDLVLGATRFHIFIQILTERIFIGILSLPILLTIYHVLLTPFNHLLKTNILFFQGGHLLFMITILIAFILLSLLFTLLQLVNFKGFSAFKNDFGVFRLIGKKALIILQFLMTTVVLICTIGISRQLDFMMNRDLGFDDKGVIRVQYFDPDVFIQGNLPKDKKAAQEQMDVFAKMMEERKENHQYIKEQLSDNPKILNVSKGTLPIGKNIHEIPWKLSGSQEEAIDINLLTVEPGFEKVLNIQIKEGRYFSGEMDKSRQQKVVINEAAKKKFGISDISNATLDATYWGENWQVIGVIEDFHYQHLSHAIEPLVMVYFHDIEQEFIIKLNNQSFQESLVFLEGLYEEVNPNGSFKYTFLEDELMAQYDKEKRLSKLFMIFTIASFLISLFGLFTLSAYEALRRTKEIGIRKVNGAQPSEVILLLNSDFTKWIILAFILACPLGWFIMDSWLQNFANKIDLSWWIFGISGIITLIIAWITLSLQSLRAANKNPIEALRYE